MTAHDNYMPDPPTPGSDASPRGAVARASSDRAAVIVWRVTADPVDEPDMPAPADAGDSPLTPRLARHLVAIYSDVHGTIIDFDADTHLRQAAEASGRAYVSLRQAATADPGDSAHGPATLIMMRWPRPTTPGAEPDANGLFKRCQQYLALDGSTIVIITTGTPAQDASSYSDHERVLLAAARGAGLHHLHDIVPVDADDGRDAFTYTSASGTRPPTGDGYPDAIRQIAVTTLVIFGHPDRRP
jgi:hypothetical protein